MKKLASKTSFIRIIFFSAIAWAVFGASWVSAETNFGEVPTGLIQLEDLKYPVFLFVPDHYDASKSYPLIISLPGNDESLEDNVREWMNFAKRRSMLVLVPTVLLPRGGTVPYNSDEWLFRLMESVGKRYRVSKKDIYLIGKSESGDYAAYLGLNYPDHFSAIALLNASWVNPLEKIMRIESKASDQIPFFVSYENRPHEEIKATEERATLLVKKGYPVHLEILDEGKTFSEGEFKARLFKWLQEKNEDWQAVAMSADKTWGQQFKKWFQRNVKVR